MIAMVLGARARKRTRKSHVGTESDYFFTDPGADAGALGGGFGEDFEGQEQSEENGRWSFGLNTMRAWWNEPAVPPVEGRGFRGDFKADVGQFLESDPTEGLMSSDYTTSPLVGRGSDLSFDDNQAQSTFL